MKQAGRLAETGINTILEALQDNHTLEYLNFEVIFTTKFNVQLKHPQGSTADVGCNVALQFLKKNKTLKSLILANNTVTIIL